MTETATAMITVNGETEVLDASTVAELLAGRGIGLDAKGVAVAVNGALVPRSDWPIATLDTGDAVEIVTPYRGG